MRFARIVAGRRPPDGLVGAILTADLVVAGRRWSKGRRLDAADLDAYAAELSAGAATVIVIEPGELHEDEAGLRLAAGVAGPGLEKRGPTQSRVDLLAAHPGVLHVRVGALERINRVDPLEVFTAFDGSIVEAGQLVASVKIAPHVVDAAVLDAVLRRLRSEGGPLIRVDPFVPTRVAVIVKESLRAADRARFERSVRDKVESLGSTIAGIAYVPDDDPEVRAALSDALRHGAAVVLTAGGRSTDPLDPFFTAIDALGGAVVRHGVPAHPGSMLWLARIKRTAVLGLPTCGAYSKATAADLVLPRLLTGERPGRGLVAGLGHGGLLTRDQRFRFPSYARDLDAPDG
ncbi:MAG TPA: molybdopterin-binding protein [Candidatus Limnocylindrales bacterium]|nr:molybdopterin-binding protein [Candidatus Limnocylindrales bacterium]